MDLILINKPGTSGHDIKHWRPIGLRHPLSKCVLNMLLDEVRPYVRQLVTCVPQFAYLMSFTPGDVCHFGSPIFTIHVLPKALLTKVVELKNRVLRRPKLEEKSVEFFMVAELLAARDFETRSGPGCSSGRLSS